MKRKHNVPNLNLGLNGRPGLEHLAVKYELDLLVLLGSYGTGHFDPGRSDIDIAFLSRNQLHQDDYLQLMGDLSAFFQYDKLDLIDLKRASGLLKYEIADKGRLLFHSKEGFFERYRLYCLRYYYDTAKFRALKKVYFQEQLGALRDAQPLS
jgi:predicted nucleotidyltransferase